jgi:cell wall-associated NlpC family hydrolase
MRTIALVCATCLVAGALVLGGGAALVASAVPGAGLAGPASSAPAGPGGSAAAGVAALAAGTWALDRSAAAACAGLDPGALAAVTFLDGGAIAFPAGVFAAYATVGPGGRQPPVATDPADAAATAAAALCAAGRNPQILGFPAPMVAVVAEAFDTSPGLGVVPATAIAFVASTLGVPYVWGGTGPDGYDCSGLVQAAYRQAGVALPRVAQDQYDAGPAVPPGTPVVPGDLIFFGSGPAGVEHVGMYIGDGEMVDAPYTGTVVRVDPAAQSDLVGATRPGGG